MGGDGDAAADVADHKIAVLIALSHGCSVTDSGLLQVQGMEVDIPVNALDAGDSGAEGQLIGIGRIHHKAGLAILLGEASCQLGSQLSRMLHTIGAPDGMIQQHIIDLIGAALHCQQTAASAHKGIHGGKVDSGFLQRCQNGLLPIGQLGGDTVELCQLGSLVSHIHGEQLFFALKAANLRGSGTGVDG